MLNHISVKNHFLSDDELSQLLSEHDVSVLPYIEASQSAVAIDALWAALPAVATPVGALPKQFAEQNALIVEKSPQMIADTLNRLLH
ncbi:MAG: glycosyltransferase [Rhodoferax sp.]|nr:glycosyltransferase [Rhodoferax sp.]